MRGNYRDIVVARSQFSIQIERIVEKVDDDKRDIFNPSGLMDLFVVSNA